MVRSETMTQNTSGRGRRQARPRTIDARELTRLKRELVAARAHGEEGALARLLHAWPAYVAELTEFAAALVATASYEREEPTAATMALAERARARALAAVFPAVAVAPTPAPATAPAAVTVVAGARMGATLAALRRARGLSLSAVARGLGLGVDVLQGIETGLIRAASIPESFARALGAVLDVTAEQVRMTLATQPAVQPALRRQRATGESPVLDTPVLDFAEAVRLSPTMSAEQKARWGGK
jgi:transcriptional regulator with XRE-family HTH domain